MVSETLIEKLEISDLVFSDQPIVTEKNESINAHVQTKQHVNEKSIVAVPKTKFKSNQTTDDEHLKYKNSIVNVEVQTDFLSHDPNCKCGCCPLTKDKESNSFEDNMNVVKNNVKVNDIFPNCTDNTKNLERICLPKNIDFDAEQVMKIQKFSVCTSTKQDCSCDVFDVNEALRRGLVLPSSNMCISKNKTITKEKKKKIQKKKTKNKKKEKVESSPTDSTTPKLEYKISQEEIMSSSNIELFSDDTNVSDTELDLKNDNKRKKEKSKMKKDNKSDLTSTSKSKKKSKPKKHGTTGCFARNKKQKADEESQIIIVNQKSIQTLPIKTQDENEQAYHHGINGTKAVKLSTNSEIGIQVSSSFLREKQKNDNNKKDTQIISEPEIKKINENSHETGTKEDSKNIMHCGKCGRKKMECTGTGCRNTIVIPMTASNKTLTTGEAESLRMIIKMQSKDTNRQLDNIMSELTYQKNEIRRLNEAYHQMKDNIFEIKKSNYPLSEKRNKRSLNKNDKNYASDNAIKSDDKKHCGCIFNECRTLNKHNSNQLSSQMEKNYNSNEGKRKFGPPNTTVDINLCETSNTNITRDSNEQEPCLSSDYNEEKRQKDLFNQSRKDGETSDTSNNNELKSNTRPQASRSVSTVYQRNRKIVKKEEIGDLKKFEAMKKKFENNPQNIQDNYNSRVLLWLKRSWINIRHKDDEYKTELKKDKNLRNVYGNKAKIAFAGFLKAVKKINRT